MSSKETVTREPAAETFEVRPWPELLEAIRPQSEEETARLRASLEEHGQQHAVLVYRDGRIVDGYHRWTILGDAARVEVLDVSEEEALALGITLNVARRQMTGAQLRKVDEHYRAAILRLREAGATQTEVAETLGVAQSTVSKAEREARADSGIDGDTASQKPRDLRVSITPAQRRKALRLVDAGKSQRKAAEEVGISLGSVQRLLRERDAATAKAAEPVVAPAKLDVEVAEKPRETGKRLLGALVAAKLDAAEVAAFVLRGVAEEAGQSGPSSLVSTLRKALTPSQWIAFEAEVAKGFATTEEAV